MSAAPYQCVNRGKARAHEAAHEGGGVGGNGRGDGIAQNEQSESDASDSDADLAVNRVSTPAGRTSSSLLSRLRSPLLSVLARTQSLTTTAVALGVLRLRARAPALYFVGGALATAWTAKALKRVVKQPRPDGAKPSKRILRRGKARMKETHGMPSTHTATITFMSLYLFLELLYPSSPPSQSATSSSRPFLALSVLALPPLVGWSRVVLGQHTRAQVAMGGALGVVCAAAASAAWRGGSVGLGGGALCRWQGLQVRAHQLIDPLVQRVWEAIGLGGWYHSRPLSA